MLTEPPSTESPVLSVVVIGRNEGARLTRCLESVEQMRPLHGPIEVIYVDSASTDGSLERAAQFNVNVRSLETGNPSASAGRNDGWRIARAPIVFFLDGDTSVDPDFVADSIAELDDPEVAVVFGNRRELHPDASIYNRALDLDWIAPPGVVEFCGGDALIRRDVLARAGGYDEHLIAAEDTELCGRIRALGYTVLHVDRPMVRHDLAITRFSQYWRRALRSGYAYAEVSERIRPVDLPGWYRQARRNRTQGAVMLAIVVGAPILSIATRSFVPILIAIAIIGLLSVRTAIHSRWKNASLATRLLHGLHSHLVQIPLLFGQLKFQLDRSRGRTAELIEYKDAPAPIPSKVDSAPL
jgi:GT2 family glycosyltransferase